MPQDSEVERKTDENESLLLATSSHFFFLEVGRVMVKRGGFVYERRVTQRERKNGELGEITSRSKPIDDGKYCWCERLLSGGDNSGRGLNRELHDLSAGNGRR